MGDALAVHHDEIGHHAEPLEGRQRRRHLAKGEQPGDIGHPRGLAVHHLLDHIEYPRPPRRPGQHHHCRPGDRPALLEADIHPGDAPHLAQAILARYPPGQAPLQGDGLAGREIPVVEGSEWHKGSCFTA